MSSTIKKIFCLLNISSFLFLTSCSDNSTNNEILFEYSQRTTNSFDISNLVDKIIIKNPIGFIFLYGNNDSTKISYVLDKTVNVKSSDLSQSEFDQIVLNHNEVLDSLICNMDSPSLITDFYRCNINLNVPYSKQIYVKAPNNGLYTSYLESDLFAETELENCTVEQHIGSLEAHTTSGNINAIIEIPLNGFCKCYSNSGDIYIKIPAAISTNINIITVSGSITIKNLNINVTINTKTELKGSIGNGEGNIYLESGSGKITLEGI